MLGHDATPPPLSSCLQKNFEGRGLCQLQLGQHVLAARVQGREPCRCLCPVGGAVRTQPQAKPRWFNVRQLCGGPHLQPARQSTAAAPA